MRKYISIESTDGVGKTTIAKALAKKLNYEFIEKPVHTLFESDNSMDIYLNMADKIHSIENQNIRAMFYGFSNLLLQEVETDKNIVTDRHILSNLCWQKNEENKEFFDFVVKNMDKPDLTVILTADEKTIRQRITNRNPNDPDLQKVHKSQEEIQSIISYAKEYNMPYIVVDTSNKTIEKIVDEIVDIYDTNYDTIIKFQKLDKFLTCNLEELTDMYLSLRTIYKDDIDEFDANIREKFQSIISNSRTIIDDMKTVITLIGGVYCEYDFIKEIDMLTQFDTPVKRPDNLVKRRDYLEEFNKLDFGTLYRN